MTNVESWGNKSSGTGDVNYLTACLRLPQFPLQLLLHQKPEWRGKRVVWLPNLKADARVRYLTPQALEAAAERALDHQTGARCLRYVIEDTLIDVMYDLPSLAGAVRCVVSRENIEGDTPPTLLTATGEVIEFPVPPAKKSA